MNLANFTIPAVLDEVVRGRYDIITIEGKVAGRVSCYNTSLFIGGFKKLARVNNWLNGDYLIARFFVAENYVSLEHSRQNPHNYITLDSPAHRYKHKFSPRVENIGHGI